MHNLSIRSLHNNLPIPSPRLLILLPPPTDSPSIALHDIRKIIIVIILVLPLSLFLLDNHRSPPLTNTFIPRILIRTIPPRSTHVHILIPRALRFNDAKLLLSHDTRVERDGSSRTITIAGASHLAILEIASMGVGMGILVHFREDESTSFFELLRGHFRGVVRVGDGLGRGRFASGHDLHGRDGFGSGPVGIILDLVSSARSLEILGEHGGCEGRAEIRQGQENDEANETGDQSLHVPRTLLGAQLLLYNVVNLIVRQEAAIGHVAIAHDLFGLVEDAVSVEIVFFGDHGEIASFFGGEGG
mmetsp:Transcript_3019/g.6606  ORF Transcript_3019/g.6606 Transcript_3019/m.6606 type:complete len:302 (-) Transcript_3019:208-1113(-)